MATLEVTEQAQDVLVCAVLEGVQDLENSNPFDMELQVLTTSTAALGQDFTLQRTIQPSGKNGTFPLC